LQGEIIPYGIEQAPESLISILAQLNELNPHLLNEGEGFDVPPTINLEQ